MLRLAVLGALALAPGTAQALPASPETQLINRIETALRAHYVFPDKVGAIMAAVRGKAASGAYRSLDEKAFAKALSLDLRAAAGDGHFQLRHFPGGMPKNDAGEDDPAIVAQMHREGQRDNWGVRSASIEEGAIGVLRVDQFYALADAKGVLEGAVRMLGETDATVLDFRECRGGEPETVAGLLSHYLPADTALNRIYGRGRALRETFATSPVPADLRNERPLFVVVGKHTASACEEAAYDLKALKRATIVGERSVGAANPGEMIRLDPHFALFVPNEFVENAVTGTNWEGHGVAPDIEAPAAQALDTAIELARRATGGARETAAR